MSGFKDLGTTPAEFVNTVRANLPENYQKLLPIAEAGQTDFTGVGSVLETDDNFHQMWHKTAITLVQTILMRQNKIVNPLEEFEGDVVATGDKIEEMIIDAAETFTFNPTKAERKLFQRKTPELRAVIHKEKRDVSNVRTIQDTVITDIFRDTASLDNYVIQVTTSLLSGNAFEKYYTTKELMTRAVASERMVHVDLGKETTAKKIQKAILTVAKMMVHPSRIFNTGNVGQPDNHGHTGINIQADFSQLRLIVPVGTSVDLNIDFFASAFHLDSVKSGLAIKEVDYFPDIYKYTKNHTVTESDIENNFVSEDDFEVGDIIPEGANARENAFEAAQLDGGVKDIEKSFDGSRIKAIVLDKRALVINPQLPTTLASQPNSLGRYTQLILQDKAIYSFSPFMPACAILADNTLEPLDIRTSLAGVKDVTVDGETIVKDGVANLNYSQEAKDATDAVLKG